MTSIGARTRQISSDGGYYIAVASCIDQIFTAPDATLVPVPWCSTGSATNGSGNSTFSTAVVRARLVGALFKDMGKSVVSSGTFFRKVQMVVPQGANGAAGNLAAGLNGVGAGSTSTFGVAGTASVSGAPDFYTGYIRLGFDGQGVPTPVASFGR